MLGDDEHYVNTREEIDEVIQALSDKFGSIVSPEVIYDVVQHCEGDYYASTVAMLSIVGDDEDAPRTTPSNPNQTATLVTNTQPSQSTMSYANMSKTPGTAPKPTPKPQRRKKPTQFTPQIESIIKYHNRGYRTLIMMRGVPGSGKSYLAKQIVDATVGPSEENYRTHIASTDDYFYYGNTYNYVRSQLSDAHEWNQKRVCDMISRGVSPVIVDNTNIKIWEMEPYVKKGVSEGYLVELVEPTTPWASAANKCAEKCHHDVPISNIKRMLDNYEYHSISGENLIKMFKLSYSTHKKPPVKRDIPPVVDSAVPQLMQPQTEIRRISLDEPAARSNVSENIPSDFWEPVNTSATSTDTVDNNVDTDEAELVANYKDKFMEMEKQLEQFDEIDQAWESGENWTERTPPVRQTSDSADPKPPRRWTISQNQPTASSQPTSSSSNPFLASTEVQDWRSYTQFLPPWNDEASSTHNQTTPQRIPIETRSISTCVEAGDHEIPTKKYKVVTGIPRDINFYYMPLHEKIPDKRMLDKSSMTNEQMLMETHRCKNEDKHFKAFRKMFMNIAKADLLDIFEKCCGDVNWAVEIVLDGVSSNSIETMRDYDIESDEDDSCQDQCNCTAAYEIIPHIKEEAKVKNTTVQEIPQLLMPKKVKKEKVVSENSIQLKRQIEKNIVLGDDHYSPHVLKIRNFHHGEPSTSSTQNTAESLLEGLSEVPQPGTSKQLDREKSDDGSNGSDAGEEETVNVNLGFDFIKKLDTLFDREGLTYSENIAPTICMPLSTLREINALWMESLTNQLEGQAEFASVLMKQDEQFARELTAKEEELESRGVEPEVPDLKEIMDMELALSMYRKDMTKSQVSPTLADKLSRNKLHAMFPDINQEMLTEMLMAHDNNFKDTVEVVLMSLGRTEVLSAEKGVEKYIAEKEMEQHIERLEIEKQKQIESEKEYPFIASKLEDCDLNMETVERLRDEAHRLLCSREANYQKAQEYIRRGITTAAGYYSSLATMQSKKYEMVNLMAANALIQVHSARNNSSTLDLHHLRVGEAIQALDLFLDKHLLTLREDKKKGTYKKATLFFITGRGLHSQNGPKIRPAIRKRLRTRGFKSNLLNPGLVSIELTSDDKMTHQL